MRVKPRIDLLWLGVGTTMGGLEYWALKNNRDDLHPLTEIVQRGLRRGGLEGNVFAALWGWMTYHFFISGLRWRRDPGR
jgi:hypothetical protein